MRQREQGAARMRIVGGRPPGNRNARAQVPRGIEILVKKAAVDPEFRATLHERRAQAARRIGLDLTPAEAAMLNSVPEVQLEAIITRTRVKLPAVPALLGKSAAAMLVALTAFGSGCDSGREAS